ncbi:MAG: gamma-glutamyl-gamma-aminobutyrate hydrolase family protein [Alphaproteobacteria bacterium]
MSINSKPFIGITLDYVDPLADKRAAFYTKTPWYALRSNYAASIENAGGIPVLLSFSCDCIDFYCKQLDGLIITGGNFHIDPVLYGESKKSVKTKPLRTQFEMNLFERFFPYNKPILGICGGMQLINVCLGGSLIHDIRTETKIPKINHNKATKRGVVQHQAHLENDTLLSKILNKDKIDVNSSHTQAVKKLGNFLTVSAKARDGIIEAIESTRHNFCVGVQWHPEFCATEDDKKLLEFFIKTCPRKQPLK